ncbi:DegV family protein [Maledivibacter halophilus]|uniref:EDD domain protein, DegV family n=1 Tax=Maledivibacter halophilus TaxID=36842 RepID=A0A1T5LID1_9FIRM|nr:DegV family protein [Maledivibacter halophilus]SKC75545.1 EDD domain protein, DegV family [Maledivibacter halophilus]
MGIKIITDSVADIPKEIVNKLGIKVLPLTVNFEDGSFKDGIDITKEEFYEKLSRCKKLPTTSQISPGDFIEVFRPLVDDGDYIIAILMSSKLSGTYNSAIAAKDYLKGKNITIIDSKLVTFPQGLLVVEAARMVLKGYGETEIIDKVLYMRENMKCKFIIDDIEYLKKGGRLTPSQALIGKLLNIKPILTMNNGSLIYEDKVRGKKKAIKWVINWIRKNNYNLKETTVGLFHSDNYEFLMDLREEVVKNNDINEIIESKTGAVVGTHAGPGCIAIAFVT